VVSQINFKTVALDLAQEGESEVADGRRARVTLHVRRNYSGVKTTPEGRTLPTAGQQQFLPMYIPYVDTTGRINLTVQVIDQSESNRGAFINAMMEEMDGLVRDAVQYRNEMICGYGSGILCRVNGNPASSATTADVDDPGGFTQSTNGTRFLAPGQIVAAIRANAIVANTPLTVDSVTDSDTVTFLANTADLADNDILVRAAATTITNVEDTDYNAPTMGLLGMVDDGTLVNSYFGVNRTSYPILQSRVVANAGGISADLIQREIDVAEQRGQGNIAVHLMHHSTRRAYLAVMENDRRYTGSDLRNPDLGTKSAQVVKGSGVGFGGVRIREEKHFPYGTWVGLDNSSFLHFVGVEGRWEDRQGSILQLDTANSTHTFTALFYMRDNFAMTRPNSSFRLDGLTTSVVALNLA
jgi:hypothetical protein